MRTIKELAKEAYDVQNACNLSGVVISFSRAIADLKEMPDCQGSDWVHSHPVTVLYADKIASLTGIQYLGADGVIEAYQDIRKILES